MILPGKRESIPDKENILYKKKLLVKGNVESLRK